MSWLPGFGTSAPPAPAPLPPPPSREDPAIAEARNRQRLAELRRRGRAASILTAREDRLGTVPLDRPTASGADTLG